MSKSEQGPRWGVSPLEGSESSEHLASLIVKLSATQRAFLRLCPYYAKDVECAKSLGTSESTLRRWKKQPAFVAVYEELFREPILYAHVELMLLANKAINTISRLMDAGHSPAIQRSAAQLVLKSRDVQALASDTKRKKRRWPFGPVSRSLHQGRRLLRTCLSPLESTRSECQAGLPTLGAGRQERIHTIRLAMLREPLHLDALARPRARAARPGGGGSHDQSKQQRTPQIHSP